VFPQLPRHEGGSCGVDEVLSLILHPLLVVKLYIFLVFTSSTVSLSDGRGVVGQICVAVVAEILRHLGKLFIS